MPAVAWRCVSLLAFLLADPISLHITGFRGYFIWLSQDPGDGSLCHVASRRGLESETRGISSWQADRRADVQLESWVVCGNIVAGGPAVYVSLYSSFRSYYSTVPLNRRVLKGKGEEIYQTDRQRFR